MMSAIALAIFLTESRMVALLIEICIHTKRCLFYLSTLGFLTFTLALYFINNVYFIILFI